MKSRIVLSVLAAALTLAGIALPGPAVVPAAQADTAATAPAPVGVPQGFFADTPIEHVVIIYQENHSFNEVLASTCKHRRYPCDGRLGPVTLANGRVVKNRRATDVVPYVVHSPTTNRLAAQNRWNRIPGCEGPRFRCIVHYQRDQIPNIHRLGKSWPISDRTFYSSPTASFGAHVTILAGQQNGFVGTNPWLGDHTPGPGWGCDSLRIVQWQASPDAEVELVPSCIPDAAGHGPFRDSPVPYAPTILERLEEAGKTWHIYQGYDNEEPVANLWTSCTYFYWCLANRFDLAHHSETTDFARQARAGTLPNFSLLLPMTNYSQHNHRSMLVGDNYIGRMLRAAFSGPDWESTAVFLTWDDCGCFYDPVRPPRGTADELNIRAPMIVISPYGRFAYTDSNRAVMPWSMLAFVQHNFGLTSLTPAVDTAYDYRESFNFAQKPRPGVEMVYTPILGSTRRRLANMPPIIEEESMVNGTWD